jgi:hypothetical protein
VTYEGRADRENCKNGLIYLCWGKVRQIKEFVSTVRFRTLSSARPHFLPFFPRAQMHPYQYQQTQHGKNSKLPSLPHFTDLPIFLSSPHCPYTYRGEFYSIWLKVFKFCMTRMSLMVSGRVYCGIQYQDRNL